MPNANQRNGFGAVPHICEKIYFDYMHSLERENR